MPDRLIVGPGRRNHESRKTCGDQGLRQGTYLHRLPVDEIKIDRSFVRHLISDRSSAGVVRAAIDVAHNLRLQSVAEGIEDRRTWDVMAALGCDIGQGYGISWPGASGDVLPWLEENEKPRLREVQAGELGR